MEETRKQDACVNVVCAVIQVALLVLFITGHIEMGLGFTLPMAIIIGWNIGDLFGL